MNGAKDHGTEPLEEVVKRESPRLASFNAPPVKDNRGLLGPAVHQVTIARGVLLGEG